MPKRRSDRPPPDRPPPDRPPHRRRWWPRTGRGHEPSSASTAYESPEAAEQERLIAEALTGLRDMDVREVMTPRVDVVALTIPVHVEDVAQAVRESGHRSFPVVNGSLDEVVGVLYVNDLFRSRRRGRPGLLGEGAAPPGGPPAGGALVEGGEGGGLTPLDISRRVRHAYVIPESRRILDALVEMRRQRRGFAVVVDEYGGVSGVLTVKDLIEPIVGELHDEFDSEEEPSIVRVDGSRWLIDARVNVDEVRDRLGIDVPEGDYVTLGGYLFDGFGHIPVEGETLAIDGWELTVQEMDKRRVAGVVARRRAHEEGKEAVPARTAGAEPPRQVRKVVGGTEPDPGGTRSGAAGELAAPRPGPAPVPAPAPDAGPRPGPVANRGVPAEGEGTRHGQPAPSGRPGQRG